MNRARLLVIAAGLLAASTCTTAGPGIEPVATAPVASPKPDDLWSFESAAESIRSASCVRGDTAPKNLSALDLSVTPLTAKQAETVAERLPDGAVLAGAWELSATDPNFGGLSGLATESGNFLLAVTDAGGWVRIALEDGAPVSAGIGYMRGASGRFLSGKEENDAEGLAIRSGIALVSFERDFRIEAFDIGRCGAAARAVEVAALPRTIEEKPIEENEGPEALMMAPDGTLRFGFEGISSGKSPIGIVRNAGAAEWSGDSADNPPGFALVAADSVALGNGEVREIYLYRAFDPIRGARSVLVWGPGAQDRLTLSRPVLTDNFEGLAAEMLETGALRAWIVSDNNFSDAQRTLLYAFDLPL